jgi:hypothetical protein
MPQYIIYFIMYLRSKEFVEEITLILDNISTQPSTNTKRLWELNYCRNKKQLKTVRLQSAKGANK